MCQIETALVKRVLEPIWASKTETSSRVRGRIEKVLDWYKTQGYRLGENLARWKSRLEKLLSAPKKTQAVEHHPALPWREVSAFMRELRKMSGSSALALEVIILTNCRTNETLQATWSEFNLDAALWTIPAGRMTGEKERFIPLSDPALTVFRQARENTGESPFVFTGSKKIKPLSNMACLALLKAHGSRRYTGSRFSQQLQGLD